MCFCFKGTGSDPPIDAANSWFWHVCRAALSLGTYNNVSWTLNTTTQCKACGTGLTTQAEGASTYAQCNFCQAGWGGDGTCAQKCGGDASLPGGVATYGPPGRSIDTNSNCLQCSTSRTGFSFDCKSSCSAPVSSG